MAHDIFDFNEGWEQNDKPTAGEIINLERDAEKQRQELLAQQWRDGELFVTTDYVLLYENPTDPSPIIEEFEPDTIILLSSLTDSTNYGGFRDVLLPVRGWVWTSVDEYDKAFHDASMMLKNIQTRETSTSVMRLANYAKRKLQRNKHKKKKKTNQKINNNNNNNNNNTAASTDDIINNDDTNFISQTTEAREYAQSDAAILNLDAHARQKTNHLYVNPKQREDKNKNKNKNKKQKEKQVSINLSAQTVPSSSNITIDTADTPNTNIAMHSMYQQSSREFSESHEFSSKFRRMSHQVTYNPCAIQKVERPLSLEELDVLKEEQGLVDLDHLAADSAGHIVGLDTELKKKVSEHHIDNKLTEQPEQESLFNKIIHSTYIRKLVHFIRSHPALLTFIYIVFTGFVEFLIFFDIITDVIVAGKLSKSGYQTFFVLSAVLIITPYFIAWSSVWGLIEKKREQVGKDKNSKHIIFKNVRRYRIFVTLFSFAPFGVIMLILFDIWIIFEFIIIRPLYFFMRFKLFRTDTFEELGYRKLRRVSEVCSETLFQAIVQLLILLVLRKNKHEGKDDNPGGITTFDVVLSLLASFFVIFLWFGLILQIEASTNGISIIEYLPIVLQGSFKFVPFLPAIEKGTKNGKKVNWCVFKFDLHALSALGRSLGAPQCNLQLIKCSTKTFKKLPRAGCKLFGRLMNTALSQPIVVIISRLDTDMEELFQLFDTKNTKNFNFKNFCRATLALRAQDNETVKLPEISEIFYELAGNKNYEPDPVDIDEDKQQKVWLLDLMLKFRTSKQYTSILDIQQPEDYCVKSNDVNLLTFVRSMPQFTSDNHDKNVILAVCQNNLQIAHVLTEDEGIPIVVEITEGRELLASYMNFHRPNDNDTQFIINNDADDEEEKGNNMVRVQNYHRLNRLRKNNNNSQMSNPMDAFDAIFSDVSIYVSVAMCEIEKTTSATKETVNQFWNEKLLFIIPYSVVDEIRHDATHTLARDTTHREHYPTGSSIYGFTGGTNILTQYLHPQSQRASLPPIKLPYNQNSETESVQSAEKKAITISQPHINAQTPPPQPQPNEEDMNQKQGVRFGSDPDEAIDMNKRVLSIEEDEDEENNSEDGEKYIKYHENTGTVHIKTTSFQSVDSNKNNENDIDNDDDIIDEDIKPKHHTGLTERIGDLFQPKLEIHTVPSESPNASLEDLHATTTATNTTTATEKQRKDSEQKSMPPAATLTASPPSSSLQIIQAHTTKSSSIDPLLFAATSRLIGGRGSNASAHRGRESALRDSLHLNKFTRQLSIGPGTLIPHFEKKIYLDFNLFDDSGVNNNNESESQLAMDNAPIWDLQPAQSMGSITKNNNKKRKKNKKKKNRRTESGATKKVARNPLKGNKSKSYNQANDDSDGYDDNNSDSEAYSEEKNSNKRGFGMNTPRSPRHKIAFSEDSGIDGGEGTFLGSAHISIGIDDINALNTYHTNIREKEIKIGKKGYGSKNEKQSKLKFKVYCNALSAYLKHGKNYGDRLKELEIMRYASRENIE